MICRAFWASMVALLDFAGSEALKAVKEYPGRCYDVIQEANHSLRIIRIINNDYKY